MNQLLESNPWITLSDACRVSGAGATENGLLTEAIHGRLSMAVLIIKMVVAWPLMTVSADEYAKLEGVNGDVLPDGSFLVANREDVGLRSLSVIDLPYCRENCEFLIDIANAPDIRRARFCLPPGTRLQVRETGQYFGVLGGNKIPPNECQLVV